MDQLLYKRDTDFIRDNMLINYCLNEDEQLLIKSFVLNNNLDIRFEVDQFYFFMTGVHRKYTGIHTPESLFSGVSLMLNCYEELISTLQSSGYCGNVFLIKVDNSKQIAMLFSKGEHPSCTPEEMAEKLRSQYYASAAQAHLLQYASTSFVGPYSGYEQIHKAYLDARELNNLYFFGVRDCVITKGFRDKTARPCDITAILANVRRLTNTLCLGDEKEALRQVDYLIDDMIAPSYSHLNFAALWAASEDVIGMFEKVYPDRVRIEHRQLDSFYTLEQYKIWSHETIHALHSQLEGMHRYSPTILMALSFINQNFATDLSLTQLSEYAYANPSSLSSEFNAEVGMSLSEYITALRIQKAQQLLRDTDASIPEIAQQTGFSGAKYFREIFKRQTGLSPQQYRNK